MMFSIFTASTKYFIFSIRNSISADDIWPDAFSCTCDLRDLVGKTKLLRKEKNAFNNISSTSSSNAMSKRFFNPKSTLYTTSSIISLKNQIFLVFILCWFNFFFVLVCYHLKELVFLGQVHILFIQVIQSKWHIFIFHGQNWFKTLNILLLLLTLKSYLQRKMTNLLY